MAARRHGDHAIGADEHAGGVAVSGTDVLVGVAVGVFVGELAIEIVPYIEKLTPLCLNHELIVAGNVPDVCGVQPQKSVALSPAE